jgi:periplasmic copper chaperone A
MRYIAPLIVAFLGLALPTVHASDFKVGSLSVVDPTSRATPKGATVGVGYMKITNSGTTPDRLISGSSDIAPKFELHEMKTENGVMKMRPVQGGLEIRPGATVELKPDSFHVMFVGLTKPLTAGERFKAELVFEKAGTVNIEYDVLAMGAAPSHDMPGMKMPGH